MGRQGRNERANRMKTLKIMRPRDGGYIVTEYDTNENPNSWNPPVAAFSTLDEVIDYLRRKL